MLKRFTAPIVAFFVVIAGITFLGTNYDLLAKPSEADQAYFLKPVPEANMVVVEPNYGQFYHPDPSVEGDSSGEMLYSSLDELARSYEIKKTQMVQFERKGKMIPNLYVFVDTPNNSLIAEADTDQL